MKKILKSSSAFITLLVMLFAASVSAHAVNCASSVDKICKVFSLMADRTSQIQTIEELDNINFDKAILDSGIDQISDECVNYQLTQFDKEKIMLAFDKFVDATIDKTYSLCDGILTRDYLKGELDPLRETMRKAVYKSTTLNDLIENINSAF